jgi:signal transduction histidine kinase
MKLVAKYTLALGLSLGVGLFAIAYARVGYLRGNLVADMRRDQLVIGNVLRDGVANVWRDVPDPERATRETGELIERANGVVGASHFAWEAAAAGGAGAAAGDAADTQAMEGGEFVSRLPVRAGAARVGTLVIRESLGDVEDVIRTDVATSGVAIALIVVFGALASAVLGAWLVGRPVARLVEHARRIGRRELSADPVVRTRDELGALAAELGAASGALAEALARRDAEAEARLAAVEQLRHSERLSTVGKLAAGIAHELGTPLSIVAGHAQMIAGGEVAGDGAVTSAHAIDLEATRMGKIVRQLLDFARRKGPEGTSCDPAAVARRSLSLLGMMAERGGVRCAIEVDGSADGLADGSANGSAARAHIDEDALQQVLTNLAVNAIQAMSGGGALRIRVTREEAAPAAAVPPVPCVRVDVADTGPGIPADVLPHIFEPFFTTKPPGDGTGLGLAVVHGIVGDHGGWIAVESGAGGTTISIYLREEPP